MKRTLGILAAAAAVGTVLVGTAPAQAAADSSCRVTYIPVAYGSDYVATVLVTNTGSTPVAGWTLGFTLPDGQQVVTSWSTDLTVNGSAVSARNALSNAYLAAGGGTGSFGFQGTYSGAYKSPSGFTLNGQACVTS